MTHQNPRQLKKYIKFYISKFVYHLNNNYTQITTIFTIHVFITVGAYLHRKTSYFKVNVLWQPLFFIEIKLSTDSFLSITITEK